MAFVDLGQWESGMTALADMLHCSEDIVEIPAVMARIFVASTLVPLLDGETRGRRIAELVELFNTYSLPSALGRGLVQNIPVLFSLAVTDSTAQTWNDLWQEAAGDYEEFAIPLGLLDAAVRYRATRDKRVLLELPVELRKLLEDLIPEPVSSGNS
jgi:hypothetical protein